MAASAGVEFGCVVAAAGAPGASDRDLYRGMLTDCEVFSQLGYRTVWVLEHHFSDYFPTPDPGLQIDENTASKDRRRAESEYRLNRVRSVEGNAVDRNILKESLLQDPT